MKVFISWSGERSKMVSQELRDWLPLVLHYVEPWLSERDITAGERWAVALAKKLEDSSFGIMCITRENINSDWILFEAGALSKSLSESAVVPYLLDIELSELSSPLSQFQAKKTDKKSTFDIVQSINDKSETPVPKDKLKQLFEILWPQLNEKIESIPSNNEDKKPIRSESEILEDLVSSIRSMDRRVLNLESSLSQNIL